MTKKLAQFVVAAGLGLSASVSSSEAQSAPAAPFGAHREVRGQVGAAVNNTGLQNTFEVLWTRPTSRSSHPLLSGAHIATGLTQTLTPTQAKFGGWFEYSPLSILDLRAGVDPSAYFGTFDSLMGLRSYYEPFDPDSRKAHGGAKAGMAARVYLSPTLKWKAGPIVGSSSADLEWWRSNADATYFYEPTRDTVLRSNGDRMLMTTNVLMYQWAATSSSLSIGALHTLAQVPDAPNNHIQKLGAIAIKEFSTNHFGLPKPRVTVVVARYLEDPFKKDQWTAAIAVGYRR